jgi:hypothetical protein
MSNVNTVQINITPESYDSLKAGTVPSDFVTSRDGSVTCISSSYCRHVFAAVECLKNIYQGENIIIEILLADKTRTLIDLDNVDSINVFLYDDRNAIIEIFEYPSVTGNNPTLGDHPLEILQHTVDDTIVDRGKIGIPLTETMTSDMMAGNLYSEIKIIMENNTYIIGCLLLGKIKSSRINQYSLEI